MVATEPRSARLPVVALLVANAISLLGTQLTVIAVPRFVLQTIGSAARTGITGFFSLLPALRDMAPPGDITDTDEVAEWTNSHHPALPLPRTEKNGVGNGRLRGPQALRGG